MLLLLVIPALHAEPLLIPAGRFEQGSAAEPDAPVRTVTLSAYRIDATEVTIQAFERFVTAGGYRQDRWWSPEGRQWLAQHPGGAGADHRAAGRDTDHPVVAVTFWEAEAYCAWVGGALPTEAQWEHAACGAGGQRFPWGDDEAVDARWYAGGKFGQIQRVTTAKAHDQDAALRSPLGLLHAAGNVWEWTQDRYHRQAWAGGVPATDPAGVSEGPWRVLRGGSFMNLPSYCTCTHREPAQPDRVAYSTGFRCAYPSK